MSRELLLLRHAKSDWPEGVADYNRPLKKRGKKAAIDIGEWLLSQQLLPDWIISSPADRARETTEKVVKALGIKKHGMVYFDDRIYEASLSQLKAVLADCPRFKRRVLLVGHNPGLDELLLDLVDAELAYDETGKILGTAHLARISLPEDWQDLPTHCGQLLNLISPKQLKPQEADLEQTAELSDLIDPAASPLQTEQTVTNASKLNSWFGWIKRTAKRN